MLLLGVEFAASKPAFVALFFPSRLDASMSLKQCLIENRQENVKVRMKREQNENNAKRESYSPNFLTSSLVAHGNPPVLLGVFLDETSTRTSFSDRAHNSNDYEGFVDFTSCCLVAAQIHGNQFSKPIVCTKWTNSRNRQISSSIYLRRNARMCKNIRTCDWLYGCSSFCLVH